MLNRKHRSVRVAISQHIKSVSKTQPSENISETDYSQLKQRYTLQHDLILPTIKNYCNIIPNLSRAKKINKSKKKFAFSQRNISLRKNKKQKQMQYNPYKKHYQDIINLSNNSQLSYQEKASLLISKLLPLNNFFKKVTLEMITMLIKIGKIVNIKQNGIIYQIKKPIKHIYIIILGRVKLYDQDLKIYTYCINGQSLGQETLFIGQYDQFIRKANEINHLHRQTAVCHTDAILLRISIKKLLKLGLQLTSKDCKHHFKQLESILRMNYIKKNQKLKVNST